AGSRAGVDNTACFDLYPRSPAAVPMAMWDLALPGQAWSDDRLLTKTGGLSFFGGPGNNYVTHSMAAMVEACRADPGSLGLVTGVGYFLTKHSAGVYSTRPPERGFVRVDPAATGVKVDATPARVPAGADAGPA